MTDTEAKALKDELSKPAYADAIKEGNDAALVDALNAQQDAPELAVSLPIVPVAAFGSLLLTARLNVFGLKDPAKQAFYSSMFTDLLLIMLISQSADLSHSQVSGFMGQAVADGLITQADIAGTVTRPGSIAEKVAGRILTVDDISFVLRGA